jgi:hypothetical protein
VASRRSRWRRLGERVHGRLLRLQSLFDACRADADACEAVFVGSEDWSADGFTRAAGTY